MSWAQHCAALRRLAKGDLGQGRFRQVAWWNCGRVFFGPDLAALLRLSGPDAARHVRPFCFDFIPAHRISFQRC